MDWGSMIAGSSGSSHETSSGAPVNNGFGNVSFGSSGGLQLDQKTMMVIAGGVLLALIVLKG